MTADRMGNRRRDGEGDRRSRPARPNRPDRSERADRFERSPRTPRAERIETLERLEQRLPFQPKPPDWGRPELAVGQRVEWNFLYKLANTDETRGTITRVGETCDIRWDDGLETVFMPPLVLRLMQAGEEAGRVRPTPDDAGPDDTVAAEG